LIIHGKLSMKHNYQTQFEEFVKSRFYFLLEDWGFGKPKCRHWSLLSKCIYVSASIEIEVNMEWRDMVIDVIINRVGSKRFCLYDVFGEVEIIMGKKLYYEPPKKYENMEEILTHINYLSEILKAAMPIIMTKESDNEKNR